MALIFFWLVDRAAGGRIQWRDETAAGVWTVAYAGTISYGIYLYLYHNFIGAVVQKLENALAVSMRMPGRGVWRRPQAHKRVS
jgi:peptidoglycan/LPS O-acetylase OafA/YrhL